jgi:hypothetical protein
MIRMSRILLLAVLCGLPSLALAQGVPAGEEQQPAPGEPGGASSDPADEIERFDRSVSPIEGTEPTDNTELGEATDVPPVSASGESVGSDNSPTTDAPGSGDRPVVSDEPTGPLPEPSLAVELQKLKEEIDQRLIAMERRIDEQTVRIEALAQAKPVEGSEQMQAAATARDTELAQLKEELQQLRSQIAGQLAGVADGAAGETTTAARPVTGGEAHRLRIHNTTGVEQPISINGVQWTVLADEWSSVPIPRGPVTVNRPGQESLQVSLEAIEWQSDKRGYYVDYDLDGHQVVRPAAE